MTGLTSSSGRLAVLVSGGVDSAILLAEALQQSQAVYPLYIQAGHFWEPAERDHLDRLLQALAGPALQPLQVLDVPVADLYGQHWSFTGRGVPDAASADEAVFLPGRNVLLLAKAMLWCHVHAVPAVALAVLRGNPFPDATPEFFDLYSRAVNQAIGGCVEVQRPYALLSKMELMRRQPGLPFELTFSCIRPVGGKHCGRCNKCAERRRAFAAAGLADPTDYQAEAPCIA
jgi:7-cyano-7-deazaguanine synthase